MDHHDDELKPEGTTGYKLSQPKQSMADYQNMGTWRVTRRAKVAIRENSLPVADFFHAIGLAAVSRVLVILAFINLGICNIS